METEGQVFEIKSEDHPKGYSNNKKEKIREDIDEVVELDIE